MENLKEQLEEAKKTVKELEEKIDKQPVIQEIKGKILEWGATADDCMKWEDAKKWCKKQGKGWRLPTAVELLQAYVEDVSGFGAGNYWSSTEYSEPLARSVDFTSGSVYTNNKTYTYYVRCVREREK